MEVAGHAHIDWQFLESVDEAARVRDIIGIDMPWSRMFQITAEDSFRELTVEFISSFFYRARPEGYVEDRSILTTRNLFAWPDSSVSCLLRLVISITCHLQIFKIINNLFFT